MTLVPGTEHDIRAVPFVAVLAVAVEARQSSHTRSVVSGHPSYGVSNSSPCLCTCNVLRRSVRQLSLLTNDQSEPLKIGHVPQHPPRRSIAEFCSSQLSNCVAGICGLVPTCVPTRDSGTLLPSIVPAKYGARPNRRSRAVPNGWGLA